MGNSCTGVRIGRHRNYHAQGHGAVVDNDGQQDENGGNNLRLNFDQLVSDVTENGCIDFESCLQNIPGERIRRSAEHPKSLAMVDSKVELTPPKKENALNVSTFTENRFHSDRYRRPIIQYISESEDDMESSEASPEFIAGLRNFAPFKVPIFLRPFINNESGIQLRLFFSCITVDKNTMEKYPEAMYLTSHLKFLTLWYKCNPKDLSMEPNVLLQENLGNSKVKSMRFPKRRKLVIRWRVVKRNSFLILGGKDFLLRLENPPQKLKMNSLMEGYGGVPMATGTYTRLLDDDPNVGLEFRVYLWNRFNPSMT